MKRTLALFICLIIFISVLSAMPVSALANASQPAKKPYLSDIGISAGRLSKTFCRTSYRYTLYLGENEPEVTITPVKYDPEAVMTIDNKTAESKTVTLGNGKRRYVRIKVVSYGEKKKSRVYTIKVVRAKSTKNVLTAIKANGGQLEPVFDPGVYDYKLELDEFTYKVRVSASKLCPLSKLHIDKRRVYSKTYYLSQGQTVNSVLTVRSQSGAKKTYRIAIKRAYSSYPDKVSALIEFAKTNLGKPYIRGKKGPDSFDCSGFVYYCLNSAGVKIKYMTSKAWAKCPLQTINTVLEMLPGDILCFKGHVGIYLGDNMMIDAVPSAGGVRIASCVSPYWTSVFICGKRAIERIE